MLRGEVYPTPFDCPLRFWAVVWAPLYRAVRTRYKTTPSLGTERGGARAGMRADAHRRQRTLSSFSRLDPLWVRNQSNTINAQEFHTRMGERGMRVSGERDTTTTTSTMSDIGDYTQPDISVGYYNNNINNVGYRRLHTFGYRVSRARRRTQLKTAEKGRQKEQSGLRNISESGSVRVVPRQGSTVRSPWEDGSRGRFYEMVSSGYGL